MVFPFGYSKYPSVPLQTNDPSSICITLWGHLFLQTISLQGSTGGFIVYIRPQDWSDLFQFWNARKLTLGLFRVGVPTILLNLIQHLKTTVLMVWDATNKNTCQTHVCVDQQLKFSIAGTLCEHYLKSALTDWQDKLDWKIEFYILNSA